HQGRMAPRRLRRAVPQSARRPRVHARPLAGRDVPSRPHRILLTPLTSSFLTEETGVIVPLSFTVVTTPADRVAAELLAVPIAKGAVFGPGADAVDAALEGGLSAFLAEAGFDGKLGETLAVPTAGRLRAKAAVLVGIGEPSELTVDGVRRAAAAV